MKIAQVPPLNASIPPQKYGGTERMVSYLTEALVKLGHDVTLFATGDSRTRAKLVSLRPSSIRAGASIVPLLHQVDTVLEIADEFDVIHFHVDYPVHLLPLRYFDVPHLTTMHGRLDIPNISKFYERFSNSPLISISNNQRIPLPNANWTATIFHGLPNTLYRFNPSPDDYVVFIGRFSPDKAAHLAIDIALKAGLPIKLAAKIPDNQYDQDYFDDRIRPLLKHPQVEYLGEIGEQEKKNFLGNARALLFPITWPEPFGLVMIEALACGTPVIAFRQGSVPEVITDGVSGFIVDDLNSAIAAITQLYRLSRRCCREEFERRFEATVMTQRYIDVFRRMRGLPEQDSNLRPND